MNVRRASPSPRSPRRRGEDGFSSLEVAILFPLLFFGLVAGVLQVALIKNAANTAEAAAQEGVRVARVDGARPSEGRAYAEKFLDRAGGDWVLAERTVQADLEGATIVVDVTGRAKSVLPFVRGVELTRSASGPVERFTSRGQP